ncbi:MAG: hypothetical protein NVS2B12_35190 [Ktedonobacteraceae bacterium]
MTTRDEQFLEVYQRYRYKHQIAYYEGRQAEFETAQNEFINISTMLMILAALMSILPSTSVPDLFNEALVFFLPALAKVDVPTAFKIVCAVLAVIFPTLSAALSTYNSIYAFERQAKIYKDAAHRLHEARSRSPYMQQHWESEGDYRQAVVEYVDQVEMVFSEERGQWGLLANEIQPIEPPLPSA